MKKNRLDPNAEGYCAEEGSWIPRERQATPAGDVFKDEPSTVTDHCVRILREREIIGHGTYNRPLMSDYKDFLAWLDDAIEEQADSLQYLVAAKEALIAFMRENEG